MRIERTVWITLTIILLVALAVTRSQVSSLKQAFLAQPAEKYYKTAATKLFIKDEGANDDIISKSFYVSYLGFRDKSCIRFVPRSRVYGGATTYCFTKGSPVRLIGVDHEAE